MLQSLIRHGLQRWRRGRRYPEPGYTLFLPDAYQASLGPTFEQAMELHAAGWLEGAASLLDRLVRGSTNGAAFALLGQVLLACGQAAAANSALARARQLEPNLKAHLVAASVEANRLG